MGEDLCQMLNMRCSLFFAPGIKRKSLKFSFFLKKKKRSNAHFIYFVCHVFMIIPVLRHNLCIPSNGLFDGQRAETDRHRAEIKLHAP